MTSAELPHLTIEGVEAGSVTVRFDPSPWVEEGAIAGVYLAGCRFVWGRFRNLSLEQGICFFDPDERADLCDLNADARHPFIDGYWGERAELVLREEARWRRTRFEATDLVLFPAERGSWIGTPESPKVPGDEVVPGGWDHHHCDICWKKIGSGGEAVGYSSPPDYWVCEECFTRFVKSRSLGFIAM